MQIILSGGRQTAISYGPEFGREAQLLAVLKDYFRFAVTRPQSGVSANVKLVHRRSMGDTCVVDFSSLLLIPALQTHRAEIEFCDLKTVKPRGVFRFNLHPQ